MNTDNILNICSTSLFILGIIWSIYVLMALRGIKIQKFQLTVVLLYLCIYLASISESIFEFIFDDEPNIKVLTFHKYFFLMVNSLIIAVQWILI